MAESLEDRIANVLELPEEVSDEEPAAEIEAPEEAPEEEAPEEEQEAEASDEEEAEEDDEPGEELVEVEYDGVLYEVPAHLKDALMRSSDYTQKTQEVAQNRKTIEVALGDVKKREADFQFAESIWDDAMKMQSIGDQVEQFNTYLRQNIDTLSSTDIEKVRFHMDELRQQQGKLQQDLHNKHMSHQQAQEQAHRELLNKGTEVLKQRIPGWGAETMKQVGEYSLSRGYTEQEVNSLVDPRIVEDRWKAMQYDSLKADAKPVRQKLESAPAIKTKARNPMPKETRRKLDTRKKLKQKSLSSKEKAKVIQENIADRMGL
jgi:hypothetical protein